VRLFPLAGAILCTISWAQIGVPGAAPVTSSSEPPPDPLGRGTPRGTVLGFLSASRRGDYATARQYMDTPLRGARADSLARELSSVLDHRLPARLNELSPRSEGSQYFPDRLDTDLVGTIASLGGTVDIVVQRIDRGKNSAVWLFSKETLDAIPALYEEVNLVSVENALPAFLTQRRIAQIPLFEWIFVLVGMPVIYLLAGLLDRLVSPLAARIRHRLRGQPDLKRIHVVPIPVRLLLLALAIQWMARSLRLSLLTRQFWSSVAIIMTIAACVWLALMLNGWGEKLGRRRLEQRGIQGLVSILRVVRRTLDLLVLFSGAIMLLSYFNLNVTAALAGLGVGGIAIALAAQKTLENVIGGISIIADRVVRVGDVLKIGTTMGTIEDIGLRSTRIRTLDRSVISIPNGQISNDRLEDLSCRDKFWLHPVLSLQYETTAAQMRSALEAIRRQLLDHACVEKNSVRVRFLGFGSSSLDVEVFAYISAVDFADFLAIQEELLLRFMDAIQAAGTRIALPSQTTYVASGAGQEGTGIPEIQKIPVRNRI
jgi:MscS family membrane protein